MKFEDIESTWGLQQPAKTASVDMNALTRSLRSQLGRRKRVLTLMGAGALIGLVAMQALFFTNLRSLPAEDHWVAFARLMLHQVISLGFVVELVRVFIRHRRLAQGRAGSVREVVNLSLAGVEGEMTDYRLGRWVLLVMMGHSLFTVFLGKHAGGVGLDSLGVKVGLILVVYGLMYLLFWRHYRRVLQPRHDELKATVQQLDGAET